MAHSTAVNRDWQDAYLQAVILSFMNGVPKKYALAPTRAYSIMKLERW